MASGGQQIQTSTTTLSPTVNGSGTLSNGNLTWSGSSAGNYVLSTNSVSIGTPCVFEAKLIAQSGPEGMAPFIGFCDAASPSHLATGDVHSWFNSLNWCTYARYGTGSCGGPNPTYTYVGGLTVAVPNTFTVNDIIGVELQTDGSIKFYKNGVFQFQSSTYVGNLTNDRAWYAFGGQGTAGGAETWEFRFNPASMTYYANYTTNLPL